MNSSWIRSALKLLDIEHLALIVFDSALPQSDAWDIGVGSPYSEVARDFFVFVRGLGFNGVQFGPQGAVSRAFSSPYNSSVFSRNPLSIALDALGATEALGVAPKGAGKSGLIDLKLLAAAVKGRPPDSARRVAHQYATDLQAHLLDGVYRTLRATAATHQELNARYQRWRSTNQHWLIADSLFTVLCDQYAVGDFSGFGRGERNGDDAMLWAVDLRAPGEPSAPHYDDGLSLLGHRLPAAQRERAGELCRRHKEELERYAWIQFIVHEQHRAFKQWANGLGLELYGDFQVGYSRRDLWHYHSAFLSNYWLGAPPSRTNLEGQPWAQPVLDPGLYLDDAGRRGPALRLLAQRTNKAFDEYDRLRIDHPHGLVCPWVYRKAGLNSLLAVQTGARLFSSPHLADHPELARYALVDVTQIDETVPRHANGRIRTLSPERVKSFSASFDVLAQAAQLSGGIDRLICEVLSTQPNELAAVLRQYGLGRFRVTPKANLDDPSDVYLSSNAGPADWMLLGNHDTAPIWQLVSEWKRTGEDRRQAAYLATRLCPDDAHRPQFHRALLADPAELAHAKFADLLVGKARNVLVSFGDLFGSTSPYNVPGTVSDDNWSQRIPRDFREFYTTGLSQGRALDLERALRLALGRVAPESDLLRATPQK